MATSSSKPGKAEIEHEAGDTLRRTITIRSGGDLVDLSDATIEVIISDKEDAAPKDTLTVGEGLVASDLANGEFKIHWQTEDKLLPRKTYWYKVKVTFSDGVIKTYLEDKLKTV